MTIDTTNMCSHLQKKLFEEDGIYHPLWLAMQDDPELKAVVRSRQLHIYGIGGCSSAELQVFIPESGSFETEKIEGMLELVSINGNIVSGDDGQLYHHTHALFSFKQDGQHGMAGGHLKSTTVLYTAEIELRPTIGGAIGRKFDPETGTGFWEFKD